MNKSESKGEKECCGKCNKYGGDGVNLCERYWSCDNDCSCNDFGDHAYEGCKRVKCSTCIKDETITPTQTLKENARTEEVISSAELASPPPASESWEKEFEEKFCASRVCRCCGLEKCDYSRTACPWYDTDVVFDKHGQSLLRKDELKSFIRSLLSSQRTSFLAMVDEMRKAGQHSHSKIDCSTCEYNSALADIKAKLIKK